MARGIEFFNGRLCRRGFVSFAVPSFQPRITRMLRMKFTFIAIHAPSFRTTKASRFLLLAQVSNVGGEPRKKRKRRKEGTHADLSGRAAQPDRLECPPWPTSRMDRLALNAEATDPCPSVPIRGLPITTDLTNGHGYSGTSLFHCSRTIGRRSVRLCENQHSLLLVSWVAGVRRWVFRGSCFRIWLRPSRAGRSVFSVVARE